MQHRAMPWLTFLGALPFVVSALALAAGWGFPQLPLLHDMLGWKLLLLSYGAIILSFIGGTHWGFALREEACFCAFRRTITSNLIALIGCACLLLANQTLALWIMSASFAALGIADRALTRRSIFPAWYGALRTRITLLVVPSLMIGAFYG